MIVHTGVFVPNDIVETVKVWAKEMADAPVCRVHGTWLHEAAAALFHKRLNALAVEYGLPEAGTDADGDTIHYGMLATGEFTTWKPDNANAS